MEPAAAARDVGFWSAGVRLAGTLLLPAGLARHPVVVLLDGAPDGTRERGAWLADLARLGVASLTWDRPGCGESGGRPVEPGFDLRADLESRLAEVRAALELLQRIPDVDPTAVAVLGAGEAGRLAPVVALRSAGVRGVVMLSTPCTGREVAEELALVRRLAVEGFEPAEIELARALLRVRRRRLRGGELAELVLQAEAAVQGQPWYLFMPGVTPRELALSADDGMDDPAWTVPALRCPLLAVFGARDEVIPLSESVTAIRLAIARSGRPDHQVVMVPGADHALRVAAGPASRMVDGYHRPGVPAPGLVGYLGSWLAAALGVGRTSLAR